MTDIPWSEVSALVGIFGLTVIGWLYAFSDPMRLVVDSARRNTGLWVRGQWSVKTGMRTTRVPDTKTVEVLDEELV